MKKISDIAPGVLKKFRAGCVIPAQPLALDASRRFSPVHQRALCRYYIDAGAGGIAVGVHSTQFEIRNPEIGLFEPVLRQTSEFIDEWCEKRGTNILKVGGVCGRTAQAGREAEFEAAAGYDCALLSLAAMKSASVEELLEHCRRVAAIIPVIGFYLQPDVGGRVLPFEFWREFMEIDNVLAVKMAPFNRYRTLDVVRAAAETGREVTLYTGNDDNLLIDLLTPYCFNGREIRIRGGLLGHWCVWTKRAVELLDEVHALVASGGAVPMEMLARNVRITDSNAALFDPRNGFRGCIPGIHEILHRQGLLPGIWCLNPDETLSPGQSAEIDRVCRDYPELTDDDFVAAHIGDWLR